MNKKVENNYFRSGYEIIKKSNLDNNIKNILNRALNIIKMYKVPDGCLGISVAICMALKYSEYDCELCIGKFVNKHNEFCHAWVEYKNKIIDLAILGNTLYSTLYEGDIINVQIINSEDTRYNKSEYSGLEGAGILEAKGWTYKKYCDGDREGNMWKMVKNIALLDSIDSKMIMIACENII